MKNGISNLKLKEFSGSFEGPYFEVPNLSFNLKGDLHETYFPFIGEFIECKKQSKYFNLIKGFYTIGDSNDQFQEVWEYLTDAF